MWEIKMEVRADQVERIDDLLAEGERAGWHVFSDVDAGRAWLSGFFLSREEAEANGRELKAEIPDAMVGDVELREVADSDWKDAYKEHFRRWHFEGLHWVPVWEKETFVVPEGEEVVWLDPGMAFGTGNHETTRLCVERLLEAKREWQASGRDLRELAVLDAGCGSGILAISAAKAGFARIAAFDNDPVAVEVSEENAELNGLSGKIRFYESDLAHGLREGSADLLLANILANVLCDHAAELGKALRPGGRLVLSGILAVEIRTVEAAFRKVLPDAEFSSREMGEWADFLVVRK